MNHIALDAGWKFNGVLTESMLTDCEIQIARGLYGGPDYTWPAPEARKCLSERWNPTHQN